MDEYPIETHFTYRTSVLPLKLNMAQVFEYLGFDLQKKRETQLIEKINEDNMPIRLNLSENNLVHNCLVTLIELHEEPYIKFDRKRKFNPDYTYKVNQIIDDASQKKIDVSSENIIITTKNMYATKAEISEYYRNDLQLDNPSTDRTKPITHTKDNKSSTVEAKPQKERIQNKRFRLFKEFCEQVAIEKNLPDSKHQTVYNSFQPPMTKKDYYSEIEKKQGSTFLHNCNEFFRDKRVEIQFSKAARHRK